MGKKYREQWRIKNFWGNRNSVAQTIHRVRHFMLYFSKYMDKHAGELSWIFKRLINIPGLNTWGGFKYPLSSLFQLYHLRRQFNTNTWSLTAQEHTELIQLHQHHMPLCVCVCVCVQLYVLSSHMQMDITTTTIKTQNCVINTRPPPATLLQLCPPCLNRGNH